MQTFAIIPAAGQSQRMGRPKLLLPWGKHTLIEHVLGAWNASRVGRVILVVHPDNGRLAELGSKGGAHVVRPETPPSDMKESVRLALEFAASFEPAPTDAWLVAPADVPGLATTTIDRLIAGYEAAVAQEGAPKRIWAPQCQGRRGHPVLLPWSLAAEVARLAPDQGLNSLVDRGPVEYVEVAPDALGDDVDTPADYNRLRERYGI